ncbi:calcium/sodium antiporter [Acaryochloris sp. IP29b_bin.137]|uniref:calcium/sodium antiporter n=1 Tax=Acaryochloris sp. IP29b_bin.137 TaxID=2969217 RepID=UPI00263044AE|nr:calcium/sodium antiporter [Acaryochloris sp. IP29b_bin.137]
MIVTAIAAIVGGLVLLVFGAEALVRGASRLATMVGLSPLIIGLTIVAYGTSAPEMAVSVKSSLIGQGDISLGNVIGSNIFNILLILGLSSLITPLLVAQQLVRLDVPIMIGVSALMLLFSWDGVLGRSDGVILFLGGIIYTLFLIYQGRQEHNEEVQAEYASEYGKPLKLSGPSLAANLGYIVVGAILLVSGSHWLVNGSVSIAQKLGISELVIGLTIISIGTSLPELATSIVASFRGERDIAVGNVIGSNIFNILTALGLASMLAPEGITVTNAARSFDIPIMIAAAVACLPIFATGNVITRWEGILFLIYYMAYNSYLVLNTMHHEGITVLTTIVSTFIAPLTMITFAIITIRTVRHQRSTKI